MTTLILLTAITSITALIFGLYEIHYWDSTYDYRIRCAQLNTEFKLPVHYYICGMLIVMSMCLIALCIAVFIFLNAQDLICALIAA